jgi:hypothetical protein
MARGIFAEYVWEYLSYEMCAHSAAYGINCATGRRSILSAGRAINCSTKGRARYYTDDLIILFGGELKAAGGRHGEPHDFGYDSAKAAIVARRAEASVPGGDDAESA